MIAFNSIEEELVYTLKLLSDARTELAEAKRMHVEWVTAHQKDTDAAWRAVNRAEQAAGLRWRRVPAPRMARTQALDWGVNSVYTYLQTPDGEKGECVELDLPPLPNPSPNQGDSV